MWMYLDSNRYNVLSALFMHEIDLTYISIPHIYKCFVFYASAFRVVCPSVRPSEAWNSLFWPVHGSVGPPD